MSGMKKSSGACLTVRGGSPAQLQELAEGLVDALSRLEPEGGWAQTQTSVNELALQLLTCVAKKNLCLTRQQRQAEGIAAAKAQGVRFGAARAELPPEFDEMFRLWEQGRVSGTEAARRLGMCRQTFLRRARERQSAAAGGKAEREDARRGPRTEPGRRRPCQDQPFGERSSPC